MSVELLAPAGSVEALDAAIGEGADAVYFGLKSFNARLRGSNFAWNQAFASVEALHRMGKKAYITVNTVMEESECEKMYRFLSYLFKIGADALIVQDLGVLKMLNLYFPNMKVHASTQMNIASSKACNVASRMGVSRVVLARELSLEEIKQIHCQTNCELEVFVHGALCISESGLCMFSSFLGGKSANRGMCTQACRRYYKAEATNEKKEGYFFSPYDLELIEFVPLLIKAGVASFKIEGRMKSAEYVSATVRAYRYVIDNWEKDEEGAIAKAKEILSLDFSRQKTHYHLFSPSLEDVLNPKQAGGTGVFLGSITNVIKKNIKEEGLSYIQFSKNVAINVGDSIRIHEKNDNNRESLKVQDAKTINGHPFFLVAGNHNVGDFVYLIQEKSKKRYNHVLPKNLNAYSLRPKDDKIPKMFLQSELGKKSSDEKNRKKEALPEGLYVQVSSFRGINMFVGDKKKERPKKLIVNLNEETIKELKDIELRKMISPFSKKDTILFLEPFLCESQCPLLEAHLSFLLDAGYRSFVLNNLAHIKILKELSSSNEKEKLTLNLIAGPYLYTFNRYAIRYLEDVGLCKLVSPIENSYDNIISSYPFRGTRSNVFITIFSYPPLFRISAPLPHSYNFSYFKDKEKMFFKAISTASSSVVLPDNPFSITQRVSGLKKDGFTHFILDFSYTLLNPKDYNIIYNAFLTSSHIKGSSLFNWKEGFYKL